MYQTVLTICGMPNRNGGSSTSDTGSAVIMRDGWSAAEARAKDSELMFKKSERTFLKLILNICKTLKGIDLQVVTSLPATGKKGVIYLVAHTHTDTGDIYDEFVWVESKKSYEKIGNTDVDLSAYVKSVDITDISETDLATMWNS